jgi:hypothetical protein
MAKGEEGVMEMAKGDEGPPSSASPNLEIFRDPKCRRRQMANTDDTPLSDLYLRPGPVTNGKAPLGAYSTGAFGPSTSGSSEESNGLRLLDLRGETNG